MTIPITTDKAQYGAAEYPPEAYIVAIAAKTAGITLNFVFDRN